MSKLLRLPLVLLIAVAMAVLWTWPATADDPVLPTAEECLTDPAPADCDPVEQLPAPQSPTDGDTGAGGGVDGAAGGDDGTAGGGTKTETPTGERAPSGAIPGSAYVPPGWLAGAQAPGAESVQGGTGTEGGSGEAAAEEEEEPEPADVPTCLAGVVEALLTGFAELMPAPPADPAAVEDALAGLDPTDPVAVTGLLEDLGISEENLAEGRELIEKAISDAQKCLPEPPTGGTPPPAGGQKPPANNNNPPPAVQGTYYANCDAARAQGAAPVHAGQPGYRAGLDSDNDGIGCEDDGPAVTPATAQTHHTGKLAYTGIELEPMLQGIAILISSGTLLLLAGVRRA